MTVFSTALIAGWKALTDLHDLKTRPRENYRSIYFTQHSCFILDILDLLKDPYEEILEELQKKLKLI